MTVTKRGLAASASLVPKMQLSHRIFFIALLLWTAGAQAATLEVIPLVERIDGLRLDNAGSSVMIGRFLVNNPTLSDFRVYLTFENKCRIAHFTTGEGLAIQQIRLVNGVEEATIYDRTVALGADCTTTLEWSPAGPAYSALYQLEIEADWGAGAAVNIAGQYKEVITILAVTE